MCVDKTLHSVRFSYRRRLVAAKCTSVRHCEVEFAAAKLRPIFAAATTRVSPQCPRSSLQTYICSGRRDVRRSAKSLQPQISNCGSDHHQYSTELTENRKNRLTDVDSFSMQLAIIALSGPYQLLRRRRRLTVTQKTGQT